MLLLFAQETTQMAMLQYFERMGLGALNAVVFALIGIALAIFGFKLFDWMTPGKLDEEILQKQNVAAAVLTGFFLLGVCIIVAAAIHG
jgi:putative membrane protein